jgi:hypothetical protein
MYDIEHKKAKKYLKYALKNKAHIKMLYKWSQIACKSDSIGEEYSYCHNYTKNDFYGHIANILSSNKGEDIHYQNYLYLVSIPMYIIFIKYNKPEHYI